MVFLGIVFCVTETTKKITPKKTQLWSAHALRRKIREVELVRPPEREAELNRDIFRSYCNKTSE